MTNQVTVSNLLRLRELGKVLSTSSGEDTLEICEAIREIAFTPEEELGKAEELCDDQEPTFAEVCNKLAEVRYRLAATEEIISLIRTKYDKATGLLDIPQTCREYGGRCFCGCHTTSLAQDAKGTVDLKKGPFSFGGATEPIRFSACGPLTIEEAQGTKGGDA